MFFDESPLPQLTRSYPLMSVLTRRNLFSAAAFAGAAAAIPVAAAEPGPDGEILRGDDRSRRL